MKVIESNCETGEVIERDMTPDEIANIQAMQPEVSNTPEPADEPADV